VRRSSLRRVFAGRVRALASARGWSLNQLADFAGLGRGFVSEVLRARKAPTLDTVEKLAAALDVEAAELLVVAPRPYPTSEPSVLFAADSAGPSKERRRRSPTGSA
jgi:transcriptional regulator with XRE-family HTH domain